MNWESSPFRAGSSQASADEPGINSKVWLQQQWEVARIKAFQQQQPVLLVLDEIQKITDWSSLVKQLWDEDSFHGTQVKVVLLGSAPLLIQKGLTESLAGRFEVLQLTHWSFTEMREAFDWDLNHYLFYGGYPGAAPLASSHERWRRYLLDSLIETTISRDILLMTRVDKPALLRRLFQVGCSHSGQIVSYQKMIGQLQDAGNTTTLAHYLDLLSGAGMVTGIQKYSGSMIRQRASSPKLQVMNTALISAQATNNLKTALLERDQWGRLVESAIGAHLINSLYGSEIQLWYWREGNNEVDYVLQRGDELVALEVKSGRLRDSMPGMAAFGKQYAPKRTFLVGQQGLSIEEFLQLAPEQLF
ncbi:MAG: ATP-binding protein [Geobacter sp.]|nr:ATP-binding protein [Geobacter sp.]